MVFSETLVWPCYAVMYGWGKPCTYCNSGQAAVEMTLVLECTYIFRDVCLWWVEESGGRRYEDSGNLTNSCECKYGKAECEVESWDHLLWTLFSDLVRSCAIKASAFQLIYGCRMNESFSFFLSVSAFHRIGFHLTLCCLYRSAFSLRSGRVRRENSPCVPSHLGSRWPPAR